MTSELQEGSSTGMARAGGQDDVEPLRAVLAEESVSRWWGEPEPMYRHARIDIFVGHQYQDRGAGTEAVGLLARFLFEQRGHHRITIDPAAANRRAIRCYEKVGFRAVGVMRQYERGGDGHFHDGLLMDLLRSELP
jgi:aminoglycoside 6'-N-acetyltransferase